MGDANLDCGTIPELSVRSAICCSRACSVLKFPTPAPPGSFDSAGDGAGASGMAGLSKILRRSGVSTVNSLSADLLGPGTVGGTPRLDG